MKQPIVLLNNYLSVFFTYNRIYLFKNDTIEIH
jgi:hypothetical protein